MKKALIICAAAVVLTAAVTAIVRREMYDL